MMGATRADALMVLPLLSTPEPNDVRSRNAMLREFFEASRYSLVAAVPMIVLHTAYVAGDVPLGWLVSRLIGFAGLLALRVFWRARFLALPAEQAAQGWRPWRRRAVGGTAGTGVLWACGLTMAFRADDAVSQMYCATLACLTCVASINVMAPVPRAFQVLVWPVALVLALLFALLDPGSGLYFAALTVAAAAMATGLAHRHARLLLHSYTLRFEREVALAQLEEVSAAKSRFIAAASHDLRQPLQALGLLVAQWRDEERLAAASAASADAPARRGGVADRVASSVQSLAALVEALLDLSHLESGHVPLAPQPMPLTPLFDRLAREFAPQADEHGLQWRVRPTPLWVRSDPLQLERMLRNLLSNALRCTASGGVLLAARARGDGVRVGVWDTGVGIAAADQQRIFEEFVRLPTVPRATGGSGGTDGGGSPEVPAGLGLGLSIVTRLARALGHRVGLRSQPGRGSCFWIDLPLAVPQPGASAMGQLAMRPGPLGLTVAVVEDDAAVREATVSLLERWGCRVWAAASLPALQMASFERLVCDWQLDAGGEQGDGLQAIAALRAKFGCAVPALLVSGQYLPEPVLAEAARLGVSVARKPLAPAALRAWLTAPEAPGVREGGDAHSAAA